MFGPRAETLRRHHALEHATIALLVGRLPAGTRLMGLAIHDGFYLLGNVSTEAVQAAATEALARLKAGESSLAVSPSCGTNLAVTGIMAGVASLLALGPGPRWRHLPDVMTAAILAVLAAQPLGRLAQKYITTSPDLAGVEIVAVTGGSLGRVRYHKVVTGP